MVASSRSCCWASWSCWVFSPSSWSRDAGTSGERLGGQVLAVLRERLACLVLQLGGSLLELLSLELDALLGGGDIGEAPLHLLQLLDLLLVGEIERLAGILGLVENLVCLGLDDVRQALHHTHVCSLAVPAGQHRRVGAVGLPAPVAWPAMDERLCLLSVHAHPDDEASKGAGTVARYHAAGCPHRARDLHRGRGRRHPESRHGHAGGPGRHRRGPSRESSTEAAEIIGYDEVVLLGYRDSGMPDTRGELPTPRSFAAHPLEETVERLVAEIRRTRPQVIITYGDDQQYYPHPDHIRVHDISVAAFDAAGDPGAFPEAGEPYRPLKMYYSVWSRARIVATHEKFLELGLESPFDDALARAPERGRQDHDLDRL